MRLTNANFTVVRGAKIEKRTSTKPSLTPDVRRQLDQFMDLDATSSLVTLVLTRLDRRSNGTER